MIRFSNSQQWLDLVVMRLDLPISNNDEIYQFPAIRTIIIFFINIDKKQKKMK